MEHLNCQETEVTTNVRGYRNIFIAQPISKFQFAEELISVDKHVKTFEQCVKNSLLKK